MMRHSVVHSLLKLIIVLLVCQSPLALQAQEFASTPHPDEQLFPEFYIVADGDFPEGYFKDVVVPAGDSVNLTVVVVNHGQIPAELRVNKANALSKVNGGFTPGLVGDSAIGATEWVIFPEQLISLEAGFEQPIPFTVSVPEGTLPGQYMSSLLVETADTVSIPGSDTLNQIIGYSITISIIVPGDFAIDFTLGDGEFIGSDSNRMISIPITNTEGYLVRPEGEWTLKNASGDVILRAPAIFGSVYPGLTTELHFFIPEQLPAGDYEFGVILVDEQSGVTKSIEAQKIRIADLADPSGVFLVTSSIEPNAEDIVFANVEVTLNNSGSQIPASNVTLRVMHGGDLVDSIPLATNQVMLPGVNEYTTRYIPADTWESGSYTFRILVEAVQPGGSQVTVLLDSNLDAEIVVP